MKNFDISSMMKQMTEMQAKLQEEMKKVNEQRCIKTYEGSSGDDGIEVSISIDGNYNIKSILIGDELKNMIINDPKVYLDVLIDLILAAYYKVKAKIDADEDSSGSFNGLDMIPDNMKGLLGNLGDFLK